MLSPVFLWPVEELQLAPVTSSKPNYNYAPLVGTLRGETSQLLNISPGQINISGREIS